MIYVCSQGCVAEGTKTNPPPRICETHGTAFVYAKAMKRGAPMNRVSERREPAARKRRSTLKRTQRRETAAEKKARLRFNKTVKSWPCWFRRHRPCERCGGSGETALTGDVCWTCTDCNGDGKHHCSGPKDAHHVVEKQWVRRNYADLPEDKLLAILFSPKIGAPLCRYNAHERIKTNRIFFHELTDDCVEFCAEVDELYLPVLTPAGAHRTSMLERLKLESPEHEAVSR